VSPQSSMPGPTTRAQAPASSPGSAAALRSRRTMNFSEAVAISTSSLWAHKLRSVLTLVGVVIGVSAVIAVVSLINGANQYVATRVFRLGADVFGLSKQPSIIRNVDDWLEFQKRKRITYDDFQAVREQCKSCKEIGASLGGRVEVKSGLNSLKDTNLRAWTPQMAELYDVDLVSGRHMTEADLSGAAPVCVIGRDVVENLLPNVDPLGKEIRWNNTPCQVIGVGKKEGSALGNSLDNWIILPLSTYNKEYGNQQNSLRITVRAGSAARICAPTTPRAPTPSCSVKVPIPSRPMATTPRPGCRSPRSLCARSRRLKENGHGSNEISLRRRPLHRVQCLRHRLQE